MSKTIIIKNGEKKAELIVVADKDYEQYAIKKSEKDYQMINREIFHNILENANKNGYEIDYSGISEVKRKDVDIK